MPAGQGWHEVAPGEGAEVLAPQGRHETEELAPAAVEKVPAGQGAQKDEPKAEIVLYVPGAHLAKADAEALAVANAGGGRR